MSTITVSRPACARAGEAVAHGLDRVRGLGAVDRHVDLAAELLELVDRGRPLAGRRRRGPACGPARVAGARAWRPSSSSPSPGGPRAGSPRTRRARAPRSSAPISSVSSSWTTFTTCWPGVRLFSTSSPSARSRTRATKSRTTSRLTSASSSARRISRIAARDRRLVEPAALAQVAERASEPVGQGVEHTRQVYGLGHERPREVERVERAQVVEALADPDELHRQAELVGDRNGDTAFGRAVELRQRNASHGNGLREEPRLLERVLAGRRVDNQQRLVWGARARPAITRRTFASSSIRFVWVCKRPGGVDDHDVAPRRHRVVGDRRRIGPAFPADEAGTRSPRQTSSCSMAAARNVSAAPSITSRPSPGAPGRASRSSSSSPCRSRRQPGSRQGAQRCRAEAWGRT